MTSLFARTPGISATVVTLALAFCTLAGWSASAASLAPLETGVIDAFIDARATRDVAAVANLLDERVEIIDPTRQLSAGPDAFYQVLPPGETIEFGARTRARDGSVSWTETVVDDGRPTWEHNLNWWMDDTSPAEVALTPEATTYTREMRAVVVNARIAQLTLVRTAPSTRVSSAEHLGGSASR